MSERFLGDLAHARVRVTESGDEKLHGPGVADLAERLNGVAGYLGVLLVLERFDQTLDVSLRLEPRDIGWSEQRHLLLASFLVLRPRERSRPEALPIPFYACRWRGSYLKNSFRYLSTFAAASASIFLPPRSQKILSCRSPSAA